jgi:hypothetical protein
MAIRDQHYTPLDFLPVFDNKGTVYKYHLHVDGAELSYTSEVCNGRALRCAIGDAFAEIVWQCGPSVAMASFQMGWVEHPDSVLGRVPLVSDPNCQACAEECRRFVIRVFNDLAPYWAKAYNTAANKLRQLNATFSSESLPPADDTVCADMPTAPSTPTPPSTTPSAHTSPIAAVALRGRQEQARVNRKRANAAAPAASPESAILPPTPVRRVRTSACGGQGLFTRDGINAIIAEQQAEWTDGTLPQLPAKRTRRTVSQL